MGNCFGKDGGAGASTKDPQSKERPASGQGDRKLFCDDYKLGEELGKGAFSVVKEGTNTKLNVSHAIKIVTKAELSQEDKDALREEIWILSQMSHPHIVRLYDVYDEPAYCYLVQEKLVGGELFDRVVAKAYYNEKEARDTCKIIFEAMRYIHSKKIAHRDLKPENLLLVSKDNDWDIKIADFGFAKKAPTENSLSTQCGTPGYVAPEILEGVPYGSKSDMWSLGVIVYILLGGYPPFIEDNQRELFRKIRRGKYEFHAEYWNGVSAEAKELIASLLVVNPNRRGAATDVLNNPWVLADDENLEGKDLGANLDKLKEFNAKRQFVKCVKAVIAKNKILSLGENLQQDLADSEE